MRHCRPQRRPTIKGFQHERPELFKGSELGMSATYALPLVDCQVSINENEAFYCIEVMNYETGTVLAHVDIYKDTEE